MTTTTCVQVKLELGHRATLREQITNDGFTHDWTVFVRGPESCNIHHFVEKVIFHLHRDFAKPKRVVKEPPYEVSESGYGSFNMAIEVYFKQKEEPKKVDFDYDLFLKTQSNVNHIRCEKLTFQNPTEEFRKKLIKAGAVGIVQPESGCLLPLTPHHYQRPSTPNLITGTSSSQGKDRKAVSLAIKAPKSTTSGSSLSSAASNTTQLKDAAPPINIVKQPEIAKSLTPTAPAKQTFLDLFGQPIKTNKNSPDPQKVKNSQSKKSSSSSNRNSSSTSAKEISRSSENIYINNQTAKDPNKSQVKEKIFSKRPTSPSPDSPQVGHKKRKRSSTSSPSSHGSSRSKEGKEVDSRVADKKVNVVKSKSEKKEKIKSGGGKVVEGRPDAKSGREVVKAVKKIKQERVLASSPSLSTNSSVGSNSEVTRPTFTPPQPRTNYEGDVCGGGEESRSSTSSFSSSVHQYKGSGPLVALMAELDDEQDDQDDVLSPLSSDGSPPRTFIKQEPAPQPPPSSHHKSPPDIKSSAKISHENKVSSKVKVKEEKSKETKAKKNSEQHKLSKKYAEKESSGFEPPMKPPRPVHVVDINDEYIIELQDLQRRILLLKDRKHLQQIVNVIEETGLYQVTSTTFDFDLCSLDRGTVKKLQTCLAVIA